MADLRNLIALARERLDDLEHGHRLLIAVGGTPAAGKSTLCASLVRALNEAGLAAESLPMDGFHYRSATLDKLGLRARKGAPETFDVTGFLDLLTELQRGKVAAAPGYSRELHDPVEGVHVFGEAVRVIVAEGNYLLLAHGQWSAVADAADICVFVDASDASRKCRLLARHRGSGRSEAEAEAKIAAVDQPNAVLIRKHIPRGAIRVETDEVVGQP